MYTYIKIQLIPVVSATNPTALDFYRFKASLAIGIQSLYYLNKTIYINGGLIYNLIINQNYVYGNDITNLRAEFGIKKSL